MWEDANNMRIKSRYIYHFVILLTACHFARMVLILQSTIFSLIPSMEFMEQNINLFLWAGIHPILV